MDFEGEVESTNLPSTGFSLQDPRQMLSLDIIFLPHVTLLTDVN